MTDFGTIRRHTDLQTGKTILEVDELDFLKNPKHPFGWFKRHFLNVWLNWALSHSDTIIAGDSTTAFDIHRFYYIPANRICIKG